MQQRVIWLRYFRRSEVKRLRDHTSVEKQREIVNAECQRRGIVQYEDFVDAKGHRSGRHETTRPEWLRLKARLLDPDVAGVIFYDFDRASRSVGHTAQLLEFCQAHGIAIISIYDHVDTTCGMGVSEIQRILMKAVFAQGESDIASQRMKETIAYRNEKGIFHGYPPAGTKPVGEGMALRHTACDPYADQVRKMLEWFGNGLSYRSVLLNANQAGFMHLNRQKREVPYTLAVVQSICNNVLFYAGYLALRPDYDKDGAVVLEGEGTYLERYVRYAQAIRSERIEALIDDEIADTIIRRRFERQIGGRRPRNKVSLLTPVLWWQGRRIYAQQRLGRLVYRTHGLQSRTFAAEPIDREMVERLCGLQFPEPLRQYIQKLVAEQSSDESRQQRATRVGHLKAKAARLRELYIDGIYTRDEFDIEFRTISAEIDEHMRTLATHSEVDTVMQHLTTLADALKKISAQRAREAVCALFERVEIDTEGIIVRVVFREWARHAFAEIASAWTQCKNDALDRCRTGNKATDESMAWLAEKRVA